MRLLWVHREIEAPAAEVWELLADPEHWPIWGPTVRAAHLDAPMTVEATGRVETVLGVALPFQITDYEAGTRWAWKVAGVDATDHVLESLGPKRSRVGFGVPWAAGLYLAVCWTALKRLERAIVDPTPTRRANRLPTEKRRWLLWR